ncbi:HaeIII family restriction endonuclease [Lonepinella sp. MS14436]|uniref:HaeIII family restriction endonuclease n=1 Tax=Lonepinella sp. MS14436 TaxID=3003619 RepID=UPI0036D9AB32
MVIISETGIYTNFGIGSWQFSFRIHNASTKVEPSLKFDIQFIGMPTAIVSIDCKWQ